MHISERYKAAGNNPWQEKVTCQGRAGSASFVFVVVLSGWFVFFLAEITRGIINFNLHT